MLYESQYYGIVNPDLPYISHHGVKGQKWGVRRYQYEDGLLTPLGRRRLGFGFGRKGKQHKEDATSKQKTSSNKETGSSNEKKRGLSDKQKKALKVGAAVAVTALAAYGGYKLYKSGALDKTIESGKAKYENVLAKHKERSTLKERDKLVKANEKLIRDEYRFKQKQQDKADRAFSKAIARRERAESRQVAKGRKQLEKRFGFEKIAKHERAESRQAERASKKLARAAAKAERADIKRWQKVDRALMKRERESAKRITKRDRAIVRAKAKRLKELEKSNGWRVLHDGTLVKEDLDELRRAVRRR